MPRARFPIAVAGALALGLLAACGPGATDSAAVSTLAKVDGWRPGLDETSIPGPSGFAVLEIAYDEDDARALWSAGVPEGLAAASGDPVSAGIYGDLADVDFTTHVIGLWSSGQSGSCPGWLESVRLEDGDLELIDADNSRGGACTDDYNAYTQVVVLGRDQVPLADTLPTSARLTHAAMVDSEQSGGSGLRVQVSEFAG